MADVYLVRANLSVGMRFAMQRLHLQEVDWRTKYMEELLALLDYIPAELESHDK